MQTSDLIEAQQIALDTTMPVRIQVWAGEVRNHLLLAAEPFQVQAFNAWLMVHGLPRVKVYQGKVLTEQSREV
jgi:hypothetical protein